LKSGSKEDCIDHPNQRRSARAVLRRVETQTTKMKTRRKKKKGQKLTPKRLLALMALQQLLQLLSPTMRPKHHLRAEKRGYYLLKRNLKHHL
jgi:hypothetical protein